MVTLRGDRMYEFFQIGWSTLFCRACATSRASRPSRSTAAENYTIGLHDQLIFPEISYEKVDKQKGMNVTIVTTAANDNQARTLLKHMGDAVPGLRVLKFQSSIGFKKD